VSVLINVVKATFHYSSQLQTWLQTWFSTTFAARFSTSSCGFATRFRVSTNFQLFCRKPCRELQQVRWFVRLLDKWNVENTRFKQVRSWLSTRFRVACEQVFDQLARIMECGLYSYTAWARLVPGCVTAFGRVNHISVCNQPPRSNQPGNPSVHKGDEHPAYAPPEHGTPLPGMITRPGVSRPRPRPKASRPRPEISRPRPRPRPEIKACAD